MVDRYTRGYTAIDGYTGDPRGKSLLPAYTDSRIQVVVKNADVLARAKKWMTNHPPHLVRGSRMFPADPPYVELTNASGDRVALWYGIEGKWVEKYNHMKPKKRKRTGPRNKYLGHMGDSNPIEHGGGIIVDQGSGPMILYFQPYEDMVSVYWITVDDPATWLDWVEWGSVARAVGLSKPEVMDLVNSSDVLKQAAAYELAGMYHGFYELDPDQKEMKISAAERKYGRMVDAGYRASTRRRAKI